MKYFLIILLAIIAILIVLFAAWFFSMKANGHCPICALKKIIIPTKLTIDTSEAEDYGAKTAPVPPMGWSSWNTFRNNINQDIILETARAMQKSGLAAAGYEYVNIDDCWQSSMRDSDGKLQGDLGTFSRGIPQLIKEINSLGLKVGLYSSNGTLTCEDMPASLQNEVLDAKTLASWGCEFFKYDFCHHIRINGSCPAIEHIVLNKPGTSIEYDLKPEDAEFTGKAKIIKGDCPSKKAIGFISYGSGSAEFTVDADSRGEYIFTSVYLKTATRKEQYMQIIVNGKLYEMFYPKSNGYSQCGRNQIKIDLAAGENKIIIKNPIVTTIDSSYIQYKRMGDALKNATAMWARVTNTPEKPITYSICEWGMAKPYLWGAKAGSMWRTTPDINTNWKWIVKIYQHTLKLYEYSGPGHFNDPDMLEVGNGKLTPDENRAHFSLWCMLAAPLMLGNDIREFIDSNGKPNKDNEILKIVTNKHLIAVDRDALGKAAKRLKKAGGVDIIARPLANGDVALCLFNYASSTKTVNFNLDELLNEPYLQLEGKPATYELHDLWTDERSSGTSVSATLRSHSTVVYRVKPSD